jgi:hypothetical protein
MKQVSHIVRAERRDVDVRATHDIRLSVTAVAVNIIPLAYAV